MKHFALKSETPRNIKITVKPFPTKLVIREQCHTACMENVLLNHVTIKQQTKREVTCVNQTKQSVKDNQMKRKLLGN